MVGFSSSLSSLELKNLIWSDQFPPFASSPRSKVISRFGLGIVLSFIVLSVVLLNVSFKAPLSSSVLQKLDRFGSHNRSSTFLSWPFSISSASGFSSAINVTNSCNDSNIILNPVVVNGTLESNSANSNQSRDLVHSDGKDGGFETAHVGTESEKLKDGSFIVQNDVNSENIVVEESTLEGTLDRGNVSEFPFVNSVEEHISNGLTNGTPEDNQFDANKYRNGDRSSYKECDIFAGEWVRDDTKPYYPQGSCPYIGRDFSCLLNGRPESKFVKWKWQPYGCDIPSFNGTDFLERLRGKKLVFVGDSLNRNMWESLVCLLRHSIQDKDQVYEISGRSEFKKKGFYAFRFEDYNCSVDFVSSPFLVKESSFSGKNGSFDTLRLDSMDETTSMYYDADVLIFNTGHWWTHEKTSRGEYYYQEGDYVHPRLKVMEAYKRALATWAGWVDSSIDKSRTDIIFRGFSVTHFRGGPWNAGGQCDKETEPIFNKTYLAKYPAKMRVFENALQAMQTPVIYLNISRLTDYRKDGHPSIYRPDYHALQQGPSSIHAQDCSHWCLPGVPDTWNTLLYVSLLKSGKGSWRD